MNKTELRAAMIRKGFTYSELGDAIGLSTTSINNKLNGHRQFKAQEISAIAAALDLTADETFKIFFEDEVATVAT